MIQSKLTQLFMDNNGIITAKLAKKHGIDDSTLRKAVNRNDIKKHSRGIFLLDESHQDDIYIIQLKYPKGVYSHETAVMLHWLTTNYPFTYHMSFPRGYHLATAEEQNIKPYYLSHKELDEEYIVELESWDGNPLRVTNLEKTIIDMMRYKHATPGIIEEMLDDYLDRDDHDFRRLERYAREFNIEELVEERILSIAK